MPSTDRVSWPWWERHRHVAGVLLVVAGLVFGTLLAWAAYASEPLGAVTVGPVVASEAYKTATVTITNLGDTEAQLATSADEQAMLPGHGSMSFTHYTGPGVTTTEHVDVWLTWAATGARWTGSYDIPWGAEQVGPPDPPPTTTTTEPVTVGCPPGYYDPEPSAPPPHQCVPIPAPTTPPPVTVAPSPEPAQPQPEPETPETPEPEPVVARPATPVAALPVTQ